MYLSGDLWGIKSPSMQERRLWIFLGEEGGKIVCGARVWFGT